MGAPTTGNREEMAERLLSLRGLKEREVLRLLTIEDLKRVEKRFGIAATQGGGGLFETWFGDEKKDLVYQLGCVLEKMAKPEEAIEQFKQIYELDIAFKDVAAKVDAYYAGKGG